MRRTDDSDTAKNAITEIQESMKKVGCDKLLLYPYAHLSSTLASPGTGLKILKEMEELCTEIECYACTIWLDKSI